MFNLKSRTNDNKELTLIEDVNIYVTTEFYEIIKDLLELNEVKELKNYPQHVGTSRLEHSIYVANFSYNWAKRFNLDYRSAARGGLLHDLFHYNWHESKQPEGNHAMAHPKIALRNAKQLALLNKIEIDAIEKHMWPVTLLPPVYKESMLVTLADKFSASVEIFLGFKNARKTKLALKKTEC